MPFSPAAAARFVAEAHASRARYENLPADIAPRSIAEAYSAQEALVPLWEPLHGRVAGRKIATTTKVMQALMGIDHPCGGLIYERRIHRSPAAIAKSGFRNLVIECELAVRIGRDMAGAAEPYDRASARAAVSHVMAAFELIEDRNAVYKETKATSLIADNAWNGGIVLGAEVPLPAGLELDGREGRLEISGEGSRTGRTDDPMGALAWLANLAVSRGAPLRAGMVVITGSCIPTLPIAVGQTFDFAIDGIGAVRMNGTA